LSRVEDGLPIDSDAGRAAMLDAASRVAPLGLHYLPGDHTTRQFRYADLVARSARIALSGLPRPARANPSGRRMRIGFVSAHVREHVVMRYFADFITKLDRAAFETLVWSTSGIRDTVTGEIASAVDRYSAGFSTIDEIARDIIAAGLDALVFVDAGLDPAVMTLASLRLAPIQAACYGHPVTTGLDSIDYYFGAELMETPRSDAHYRERLVRLPGLGASIQSPPPVGDGQWVDALRPGDGPIVLCLQNLSKIPPAFDGTLASILARSGARLVVLNRGHRLTQRFRGRFERALDAHGLPHESLHVEPSRDRASFMGGIARADLVLDTPHFSGGATSLDAFAAGTPVVTFEGSMARARQTSAMVKIMEIPELIASDEQAYSRIAVDLLGDRERALSIRERIVANSSRLFRDARTIAALGEFLREAIRSSAA
jgi:predicted O-linked N-acetylglucosamine transferase (SPINDLY family)